MSDEKVDSALRRTDEVHRQTGLRREKEIQELRQVIVAKEHGIDSLRETLSCTKRSLESRVRELETALRNRDNQVGMRSHRLWHASFEMRVPALLFMKLHYIRGERFMAHMCRTTFYLQENLLQLATMVEKIECCESSHSQLEQHTHQLRQQLEAQQAAHMQQNSELRAVLQDSQAGLKHLVRDKVCSCGQDIFTHGLASSLLFAWSHASHLRHTQKQTILDVAVHWTTWFNGSAGRADTAML